MKKSGFLEGAFIATLAIFLSKFLGIIYVIPFYSIVGPKGGALYGYAYNIYNLFLIISSAGIPLAISKLTSEYNALEKYKEKEYLYSSVAKIIIIFSIISFLICFIFAPQISHLIIGNITGGNTKQDITFVIRCVSFALLIVPMLSINRGYLQGHGFIKPASFSQVIEQFIRIIVIILGSFLSLKVFHLSLKTSVGIAVFGATMGAFSAYFYLLKKTKKIKTKNDIKNLTKQKKKTIIKKIINYSIPFIVISVANTLYNSIDMILLIKGLNYLNFNIIDIETISSIFTTWGNKLNMIITSIAVGVAISLVPNLSEDRAKKNYVNINDKFNKLIQIFFYVALPLSIFMSIFAKQIWTVFYGDSHYGPLIFKALILTAAMDALYIMICNGLQGLNKTKLVYTSVLVGLSLNIILDIPLMILFNKIMKAPYYGAICATIIGYLVSLIIPIYTLKKEYNINYHKTNIMLPKLLLVYLIMIFLSFGYRGIISNVSNRILLCLLLIIFGLGLFILYYYLNKKDIKILLGKDLKDYIRKKRS